MPWIGVKVAITQWLSDDPQPGIVAAELWDVHGHCWHFTGKQAHFETLELDAHCAYPHPGMILCRVLDRRENPDGGEIVRVELDLGDEVEVSCSQMVEGG